MEWKTPLAYVALLGFALLASVWIWNSTPYVQVVQVSADEVCFKKHLWSDPIACVKGAR